MKLLKIFKRIYTYVVYGNDHELLYHPQHKTHVLLNIEALVGGIGLTLMQGTFQSGFLIKAGATDAALAFAAMLAVITGVVAPFGGLVYSRMVKRRWFILTTLLVARLLLSFIVFVPLVIPKESTLCVPVMLSFIAIAGVLTQIGNVGYEIWMAFVVPANIRGRFTAARSTLSGGIVPFCSLIAATFLDSMKQRYFAFVIIFSIGAILVITEAIMISRIEEPVYPVEKKERLKETLKNAWEAKPYLRFVMTVFLFYLFYYISSSFLSVYLLKYHGFSYTLMTLISIGVTVLHVLQYRRWGRLCDRIGADKLLFIAICLYTLECTVWLILPVKTVKYLFFIFYIINSMSSSALTIAIFSRKYELMPKGNQPLMVSFYTAIVAIAGFIGPSIGTAIKGFAESHMTEAMLANMWNIRILYAVSSSSLAILILSILLIKRKPRI